MIIECHCGNSEKSPPAYTANPPTTQSSDKPVKVLTARERSMCPRCLEQVTGKRWFHERPEHDHLDPCTIVTYYKEVRPEPYTTEYTYMDLCERFCIWQRRHALESRYRKLKKAQRFLEKYGGYCGKRVWRGHHEREANAQWRGRQYSFMISSWYL